MAAHSLRECRGAMARRGGRLPYLGYPVTPMLARMLACKVDYTEIRLSRNDDGAAPVAAHSVRECRGAMVGRRMLFAYLGYPFTSMHVCGGGRDPIFGFRNGDWAAQLSSRNLAQNAGGLELSSTYRFAGLHVNDEHVPRPMHACTATVRVEL